MIVKPLVTEGIEEERIARPCRFCCSGCRGWSWRELPAAREIVPAGAGEPAESGTNQALRQLEIAFGHAELEKPSLWAMFFRELLAAATTRESSEIYWERRRCRIERYGRLLDGQALECGAVQ